MVNLIQGLIIISEAKHANPDLNLRVVQAKSANGVARLVDCLKFRRQQSSLPEIRLGTVKNKPQNNCMELVRRSFEPQQLLKGRIF